MCWCQVMTFLFSTLKTRKKKVVEDKKRKVFLRLFQLSTQNENTDALMAPEAFQDGQAKTRLQFQVFSSTKNRVFLQLWLSIELPLLLVFVICKQQQQHFNFDSSFYIKRSRYACVPVLSQFLAPVSISFKYVRIPEKQQELGMKR